MVTMNDPETHELGPVLKTYDNWDFLGKAFDQEISKQIAYCDIDPITHESLAVAV